MYLNPSLKAAQVMMSLAIVVVFGLIVSCSKSQNSESSFALLFSYSTLDDVRFRFVRIDGSEVESSVSVPSNFRLYGASPDYIKLAIGLPPDSIEIVEMSSGKVINTIQNAGVNEFHELAEKGDIVSWSPDESKFVFLREISSVQGTALVLVQQNDSMGVLTDEGALYRSPVWSPDGKQIAAARMPSCGLSPQHCPPENNNWNIVVFDLESHTVEQLTNFESVSGRFQNLWSKSLCGLHWSPTGDFILFESSCSQFGPNSGKEIFVVSADGEQIFQLTDFDYDDSRYIVRYIPKWVSTDNQLFVGYSIIPMMPPSYELVAIHGYDIYEDNDFNEAHPVLLEMDNTNIQPEWETFFDEQFVSTQKLENSNCKQLIWNEVIDSTIVMTPKANWPVLAPDSNVLISPDGTHVAYYTVGDGCNQGASAFTHIVIIDLENDKVITSDVTELSEHVDLVGWLELPK